MTVLNAKAKEDEVKNTKKKKPGWMDDHMRATLHPKRRFYYCDSQGPALKRRPTD